jgi:hypothetical protein
MHLEQFLAQTTESFTGSSFVRLVLTSPLKGDDPERTLARLVDLKGQPYLSLTLRYSTRDVTKNLPAGEVATWLREQLTAHYRGALLSTTGCDWQFSRNKSGKTRLIAHKPATTALPSRSHDREKHTFLDNSAHDWLEGLDALRPAMADKRRQIDRYLEILSHLTADCGWTGDKPLTIADMGAGKGYLTFGAWHFFRRARGWPVRIIGVETRPELVETTNALARQIGAEGLEFIAGTIQSVALPPLDALIALHACDTATDDAIRRGIELAAKLIVVAPCCHKEMRPQLAHPESLAPVLAHGIMAERMAEWVTDGVRALHLEAAGYRTKIIEFVASEHTPKNLMIAAIRTGPPTGRNPLERFREFFGIRHHALD